MVESALLVFSRERDAPPLRLLRDALVDAEFPVSLSLGIAGEATEEELEASAWEAVFVRWREPELHEVWLLERVLAEEEEAVDTLLAQLAAEVQNLPDSAGRRIVLDHLSKTAALYPVTLLPALITDDDHPAWGALDVALRCLAENTEGLIYAETEGFYDSDGEMLLEESDTEEEEE